jgi:hypothetical protein
MTHSVFFLTYVTAIHLVWAACIALSKESLNVTALFVFRSVGYRAIAMAVLGASSLSAIYAIYAGEDVWLIPQQIVVVLTAIGALHAIKAGQFLDGVKRSRAFLLADQANVICIAIWHTLIFVRA